jgi:PAS domain S-box-containing protein
VFCRIHKKNFFGDNLLNTRPIIKASIERKHYLHSYEDGKAGGAFRYVYPVFHNNKFIGVVEIGISVDWVLDMLKNITKGEYFAIFTNKNLSTLLLSEDKKYFKAWSNNPNYLVYANHTSNSIENKLGNVEFSNKRFVKSAYINGKNNIAIFIPIMNIQNENTLWIGMYQEDITSNINHYKIYLEFGIISFIIIIIYGFIIYNIYQRDKLRVLNNDLQEYIKAVDNGSIISKGDTKGIITYVNKQLCDLTGYTKDELIGKPHNIFRHPQTPKSLFRDMWATIKGKQIYTGVVKNVNKSGDTFFVKLTIVPLLDNNGDIKEYIAFRDDVTALVERQSELENIFSTDALTNLGNRFKLITDISYNHSNSLAILNIDRFREINDFYGNKIGDYVIIELGNKLFEAFNKKYYKLYRLHADEFAILDISSGKDKFVTYLTNVISSIRNSHFEISGHSIPVSISCGVSHDFGDIIQADIALKTAKRYGKYIVVFDESIKTGEEYKNNILWTSKIKKAITDDRIVVYYQGIYDNKLKKIEKYESLVRMIDEDGSIISPFKFLSIAKSAKLYTAITKIVIEKSINMFYDRDEVFSINLTVEDIMDNSIVDFITTKLQDKKINSRIIFEIVESEGIECLDDVKEFIKTIKYYGSKISIDDFGTGYSNFDCLIKLQADYIKIDGSLIKEIDKNSNSYAVVETIVSFAKKQNLLTVAEFVSDESILQKVQELEIDYSQGYFIHIPSDKPI